MPIANVQDAREIERSLNTILSATDPDERARAIRAMFVETLDFERADLLVPLNDTDPNLPADARLLARRDGFGVLYVPLDGAVDNQVKTATASAAAKVIGDTIADEPLLLFTSRDCDQLHVIYPDLTGARPLLQRMVVHRGQPARTVVQQIANLWHDYGELGKTVGEAVRNAFSVQPVTDAFFKDYKAAYDESVKLIAANIGQANAEQFTQTLFNRLLFVHFVSRKGWLRFNGDTDYLNALWRDYQADAKAGNFYTSRLTTLFFAGLNNPQSQNLSSGVQPLIGDVPFLNGGLFEEVDLDRRAANVVPDEAVAPLITGLFNRYNFTVMEATPLDTEVAVDPEMLGKLFEKTVNERNSNGAYYTPRPVVAFMCREAIKGYLAGRKIAGLDDANIADLVDNADPQAITVTQALEVANAVANLKAVDPACGSGAFLLGMLQEIIALNETLFRAGHTPESLYQQKLDIISKNIYGVDKDKLAVSTAMLRLWLSLAVDFDGEGTPAALPNLDLKLVDGDAIAGPDPRQSDLTRHSIAISDLKQDIDEYTTAKGQRKADLKEKVTKTKSKLRKSIGAAPEGVVEWRIDFADAMLNGGFDMVIANPPYVRQEKITPKAYKDSLAKAYADAATARSDLYCYFYARGLQLLADGGMHVLVCSNSWLDVGFGAKLQEHLLNNAHVQAIYDSAVERQFATADINTIISVIRKADTPDKSSETCFIYLLDKFEDAMLDPSKRREVVKRNEELRAAGTDESKKKRPNSKGKGGHTGYVGEKWGGKYLRAPDIYRAILDQYGDKLVRLGDIATVRFGIKTGANKFFYLTPERIAEFGIEAKYCRPVMTTPQESRSIAVDPASLPKQLFMCHEDKDDLAGTGALAYIEWGEMREYHTRSSTASRPRWYDLGKRDDIYLGMNKFVDTTARTFLTADGALFSDNFQIMPIAGNISPTRLCAAVNSTLFQLMLNTESRSNFGEGVLEIQTYETANLQILNPQLLPEPNESVFNAADWDVLTTSVARRHIDDAVFDALGLTSGERDTVYEGVTELVQNRRRRARSVREPASAAGADKPPFRLLPHRGGFVPGVTADNLKDTIFDLEDEEFMEKLGL